MKRLLPYFLISVTVILIYVDVVIELDRRARERLESVLHSEFLLSAERQASVIDSRMNSFLEQIAHWAETNSIAADALQDAEALENSLEPVLIPSLRQVLLAVVYQPANPDAPRSIYLLREPIDFSELELADLSCCQMESGPVYSAFFSTNEWLLADLTLPVGNAGQSAAGLLHFLVDLNAVVQTGPLVEGEVVRIFSAGQPDLSDESFSQLGPGHRERFLARLRAMPNGSLNLITDDGDNLHLTW